MATDRFATLHYGSEQHYLDHLAPLASLLEVPLLVSDLEIESLAKTYYPNLNLLYNSPVELGSRAVLEYDVLFTCLPKKLFCSLFFIPEMLHQKEIRNIWCPHGSSDKGRTSYFMEELREERWACLYGKQMADFLKEKEAFEQLEFVFYMGNYRYKYYKKHQDFYNKIMEPVLASLTGEKTLIYAPTWNDCENNSTYSMATQALIDAKPKKWNLVIKPHPNTPHEFFDEKENVLFLEDFPPIYPLLSKVDAYLGDMSSIGYDCLTFQTPLFFLSNHPKRKNPLHACGTIISMDEISKIFDTIENTPQTPFREIQKKFYANTFQQNATLTHFYDAWYRLSPC